MKGIIHNALFLMICGALLCATGAHAATITGPSTSTTGSFTLTWPVGYELRLKDASWRFAAAPTTSFPFSNLPSGTYNFQLTQCTYVPPPVGPFWSCVPDTTSNKTVTVTRDNELPIDFGTTAAGTTGYSAGTTARGSAAIAVPIRTLPGVNGHAPSLSLVYDSTRASDISEVDFQDDDLGYGWRLQGLSRIHRCRSGLSGSGAPTLGSTDTYCLDGQLLKLFSGVYGADGSVYRTERQSNVQVTRMAGDWFEVRFADGRVAKYGDTATSKINGSGQLDGILVWLQVSPTVVWAEREVTNTLGDVYTVDYEVNSGYGLIQPKSLTYGGAVVEFKYGPRSDLASVYYNFSGGFAFTTRSSVLHTIKIKNGSTDVREYRLDSNLASGRMQLDRIQECGYGSGGSGIDCLKPLELTWTSVSGGAPNFPIAVASITDGLGARTEYAYAAITTSANPLSYAETPYGTPPASPSNLTAQPIAAVSEMRKSNGITPGAANRWTYGYKAYAYQDNLNRGYLGFYETRVKDEQSGVHAYTQHRLDGFFKGAPSQIREYAGAYSASTELLNRREISYQLRSLPGGTVLPIVVRDTRWQIEANFVYGATETEYLWCFVALSGDNCPDYVTTTLEQPRQLYTLTQTGEVISVEPPASSWGDVQNHAISSVKQTSQTLVNFQNSTSPWIHLLPVKRINIETTAGESAKSVTDTFAYFTNTSILSSNTVRSGASGLNVTVSRAFSGNNLTTQTVSGGGFTSRTTTFGSAYVDDRYPPSVNNALSQLTQVNWDTRFGSPTTVADPDSNQQDTQYDEFGRVVRTVAIDGTTTDIAYDRCDVVSCYSVVGAQPAMKISTSVSNAGMQVAPDSARYVDVLGRPVLEEVEALDTVDGFHLVRTVYNTRGRVKFVSRPYFTNQTLPDCTVAGPNCTWFTYDMRSRVTREDRPDGGYTTNSYSTSVGVISVVTTETVKRPFNSDQLFKKQNTFNVLGRLIFTIDALNTSLAVTTNYYYDSHGNLKNVYVNGTLVATMTYDLAGNRTQLVESNSGTSNFVFNGLGELTSSTDAQSQPTSYTYDLLGRLTNRSDRYGLSGQVNNTWDWDAYGATGQLESVTNGLFTETYTYGLDAKLTGVATNIAVSGVLNQSYNRTFGYDSAGRVSTIAYPNLTVTHAYASHGYLTQYKNGATVLDEVTDTDAYGNVTEQRFQNAAMRTSRTYEQTSGRLLTIQTGTSATPKSIQDLEVVWQSNSSVLLRQDKRNTMTTTDDYRDVYNYDELNRLYRQQTDLSVSRQLDFTFDSHGNLKSKLSNVAADLGVPAYTYDTSGKPHRLLSVNIGGNVNTLAYSSAGNITQYDATTGNDTWLEYDGQHNVTKITVGTSQGTSTPKARDEFWYTPDGERFLGRETWDASGVQRSAITTYLGAFEEVRPASNSGYNLFRRVQVTPNVQWTWRQVPAGGTAAFFRFLHRDHLGSVDALTDNAGTVINKTSFDPFGGRRAKTWSSDISVADLNALLFVDYEDENSPRGFTDHEMLSRIGFIHMNGRVYDPRIGRFVSPDPIVQSPTFSQSYNRYAYVFNNPLAYTDPSGFFGAGGAGETLDRRGGGGMDHYEGPPSPDFISELWVDMGVLRDFVTMTNFRMLAWADAISALVSNQFMNNVVVLEGSSDCETLKECREETEEGVRRAKEGIDFDRVYGSPEEAILILYPVFDRITQRTGIEIGGRIRIITDSGSVVFSPDIKVGDNEGVNVPGRTGDPIWHTHAGDFPYPSTGDANTAKDIRAAVFTINRGRVRGCYPGRGSCDADRPRPDPRNGLNSDSVLGSPVTSGRSRR